MFQSKFENSCFFRLPRQIYCVMQNRLNISSWFIMWTLILPVRWKTAVSKTLSMFDVSLEDISFWKVFVDVTKGRTNRWFLSSKNSRSGRDASCKRTHIVLSRTPCVMVQVSTMRTHLCVGWQQFIRYREATSIPLSFYLIDLSLSKDDWLHYSTNKSILQKRLSRNDQSIWSLEVMNT